jgi:hypothetical protein
MNCTAIFFGIPKGSALWWGPGQRPFFARQNGTLSSSALTSLSPFGRSLPQGEKPDSLCSSKRTRVFDLMSEITSILRQKAAEKMKISWFRESL